MANALAAETSPYLRQHQDNPVDWLPWGATALGRARDEDKPLLVSIGYSACHWCHVMERESFEDPEVAAAHERALRLREGRPRGATRRRRHLHGGGAGDDGPRRLAAQRLLHARPGAVLRRDLLPADAAPGHAGLAAGARGDRRRVADPARRDPRSRATRSPSAWAARRCWSPRASRSRRRPRRGGRHPARPVRLDPGRLRRRAEVPAVLGAAVPARPRRARDVPADAAVDGRRRDQRPDRRRLRPLRGRQHLDRAALREDALRQRAARPGVPARVARERRPGAAPDVRGDARVRPARAARPGGRLLLAPSTPTPRARRASSTSGRSTTASTRSSRPTRRRRSSGSAPRRRATSRARTSSSPAARSPPPEQRARIRGAADGGRARSACGRGSTTSGSLAWNALALGTLAEAGARLGREDLLDAARANAEFLLGTMRDDTGPAAAHVGRDDGEAQRLPRGPRVPARGAARPLRGDVRAALVRRRPGDRRHDDRALRRSRAGRLLLHRPTTTSSSSRGARTSRTTPSRRARRARRSGSCASPPSPARTTYERARALGRSSSCGVFAPRHPQAFGHLLLALAFALHPPREVALAGEGREALERVMRERLWPARRAGRGRRRGCGRRAAAGGPHARSTAARPPTCASGSRASGRSRTPATSRRCSPPASARSRWRSRSPRASRAPRSLRRRAAWPARSRPSCARRPPPVMRTPGTGSPASVTVTFAPETLIVRPGSTRS